MPGFFISNINANAELKNMYPDRCIKKSAKIGGGRS